MIYIIKIPSLEKFKEYFYEYKEVTIGKSTVIHIDRGMFFMCIMEQMNPINSYLYRLLQQVLHNYEILQIEET